MSEQEIAKGSVGISETSHALLVSLVHDDKKPSEDRPFESIVEAFRFAFALGFSMGQKQKREGKHVTVAPRQFIVTDYYEILKKEVIKNKQSLGGAISEYAEGGCFLISETISEDKNILDLITYSPS
jgi:hypothetical protein